MLNDPCELEEERDRNIMKNLSAKDFDAYLRAKMKSLRLIVSYFKKTLFFVKK